MKGLPCPKCGIKPKYLKSSYCRECSRELAMNAYRNKKAIATFKVISSTAYKLSMDEIRALNYAAIRSVYRLWVKTGIMPVYHEAVPNKKTQYQRRIKWRT